MASDQTSRFPYFEATLGIVAGMVLVAAAWLSNGGTARQVPPAVVESQQPGKVNAAIVTTPSSAVAPPHDCVAPAAQVATAGFDPYHILAEKRPDVLNFYASEGWNPATQCIGIFDNWLHNGPDGKAPTTPVAFISEQGWAPATPRPVPTPLADCAAPAEEVALLGFDPYTLLALHRPDVLAFYAQNPAPDGKSNWDPTTHCVAIFDNWLQHPDGGPPLGAVQYVEVNGWARPPAPTATNTPPPAAGPKGASSRIPVLSTPSAEPSERPVATSVTTAAPTPTPTPQAQPTATPAWILYTVQKGDTLYSIARRWHVSVAVLVRANGISNPDRIDAGQVLRIPSASS